MNELLGSLVILVGSVFLFSAGLGVLRMPDSYNRIQTGTKASTLGTILILIGLCIYPSGLDRQVIAADLLCAVDQPGLFPCLGAGFPSTGYPQGQRDGGGQVGRR